MVLTLQRWKGKYAVVTGASSGIGAAIAKLLVEQGLNVIGLARRVERIEDLSKSLNGAPGKLYGLRVDIGHTEELIEIFRTIDQTFGAIHILINNAGIVQNTTLMNGDVQKWKKVIDINLIGLCVATKEAISSMRKHNVDGHIIHINSDLGHVIPPLPNLNVYPATKFGVTALTEILRAELMRANQKIKVTSISPGLVKTEIFEACGGVDPKVIEAPALSAEDVAEAVVYILSTPPNVQVHELMLKPLGAAH